MKATRFEFGDELIRLGAQREDFVICNPDTQSCGLENFDKTYPNRAYTFGIAEQTLLDAAAGMASCGNKVYVPTFAVFLTERACEQIRQFICYPNQNVTLLGTHTGLQVGKDGGTHICLEDVSVMRGMPNMTIIQPADAYAARAMARFSLDFRTPLYIRLHRSAVPAVYDENYEFHFGKAEIIRDYGSDVALLASGVTVTPTLEAAEELKKSGIKAKVVDVATIKPIDDESIEMLSKECGAIVTVEDHNVFGGLGTAVADSLALHTPCRMRKVGVQDCFGESADPEELYQIHRITPEGIAEAAISLLKTK